MELNLTPEDIEQLVKNTIMKSGFGAAVEKSVTAALGGYNSPIDKAIQEYVLNLARNLVHEKLGDQIKPMVVAAIEAKVNEDFLNQVVTRVMQNFKADY